MKRTPTQFGEQIPAEELKNYNLFPGEEGMVQLIYGRIRQGKSTYAARCMFEDLMNGRSVYSNLNLDLSDVDFDQREMLSISFENMLFGQKLYYRFLTDNFHYFNPATGEMTVGGKTTKVFDPMIPGDEVRWLNSLTDCVVYYDEGHWLMDSYDGTKVSMDKRRLITETGHVNRRIVLISQRTQSIHVNARGNVNQYFRCRKDIFFFFFMRLQVEEFQDMKGNDVDETADPISVRIFWSNSRYWRLFNTHTLRAGRPRSQEIYFEAYYLPFTERVALFFTLLFARKRPPGGLTPPEGAKGVEKPVKEPKKPSGRLMEITKPAREQK